MTSDGGKGMRVVRLMAVDCALMNDGR